MKSVLIAIRVTEAERMLYTENAKSEGISLSQWMRVKLMGSSKPKIGELQDMIKSIENKTKVHKTSMQRQTYQDKDWDMDPDLP